jgi:hypothetical protein
MRPPRPLVAAGLLVAVPAGASAAAPLPPARPLTSPIVVNDNVIDITMRTSAVGRIVRVSTRPATAAYDIDMRVKTVPKGAETHVVVGPAHGRRVSVTGTLAASTAPFVQSFRVLRP